MEWKRKSEIFRDLLIQSGSHNHTEAILDDMRVFHKYAFDHFTAKSGRSPMGGAFTVSPGATNPSQGVHLHMFGIVHLDEIQDFVALNGRAGGPVGALIVEINVVAGTTYLFDFSIKSLKSDMRFGAQSWNGPLNLETGQGSDLSKFIGQQDVSLLDSHLLTSLPARDNGPAYMMVYPHPHGEGSEFQWDFFQCHVTWVLA
jgi:hypothetical protein